MGLSEVDKGLRGDDRIAGWIERVAELDLNTPDSARTWSAGWYSFKLKDTAVGAEIMGASREAQRDFVLQAFAWIKERGRLRETAYREPAWHVVNAALELLRRKLPFAHDEVHSIFEQTQEIALLSWHGQPQLIKLLEHYLEGATITPELNAAVGKYITVLGRMSASAESRRWVAKLQELSGLVDRSVPLTEGEPWADAARAAILGMEEPLQSAWIELLQACKKATGAHPSPPWLKVIRPLLARVGADSFKQQLVRWLPLVDKPATANREHYWQEQPELLLDDANADALKALAWLCAESDDRDLARALTGLALTCYRKLPGVGPRCPRVANACIWALGAMPSVDAVGQLARLKARLKLNPAQKQIEQAIFKAARRLELPESELEEISVPAYGLQEVGLRREQAGEFLAELQVTRSGEVQLSWLSAAGKPLKSTPQAVKQDHGELLRELTGSVQDIRKMLPAQRDRIENLYLERRSWELAAWRERYLDHPLVGSLARRLIWTLRSGGRQEAAMWHEGQLVGCYGQPLAPLDAATSVELWHPLAAELEEVLAWRRWVYEQEIQQPFKQAHREVYLLTDAERATGSYSNRFAAHIIKQHQFNALCGARGWKNALRLMVDASYPPPSRTLRAWGLRAEFWVESVGDTYGTDTNETGTYLYLTTDQVRFYPLEAAQRFAHAGGGGYHTRWRDPGSPEAPIPLEQLPPLVFSEIMRDVDLFVGVASVANDPTWSDGGPEGRHLSYWTSYSFGNLSETAKMRRQVLEQLLPRLAIAGRCQLSERFLQVRGDLRTYKIHLGSGNILMEPNDQYLCIVASRGADGAAGDKIFLPFAGDTMLSLILSKAFLLARDTQIKDPTIVSQIRPA